MVKKKPAITKPILITFGDKFLNIERPALLGRALCY